MDDQLRNLKEKMNSTVFREIRFEEKNEKAVLRSIKKLRKHQELSWWKKKLTAGLSIAFTAVMFAGIAYFAAEHSGLWKEEQQIQELHAAEDSMIMMEKQTENDAVMSKEDILTMMLNSIDHFDTAKGRFIFYNKDISETEETEFELSLKDKTGGYNKLTRHANNGDIVTYWQYNDKNLWIIDENKKLYRMGEYVKAADSKPLSIEETFQVNNGGERVIKIRWRPPIGYVMDVLFPSKLAADFLGDFNQWEIEKQNERLAGHNTVVIKGNMKHDIYKTFRFWVDKDTGILMQYEQYDSNGEAGISQHVSDMEINVPVDSKKFTPNLEWSGFKREDFSENPVIYDIWYQAAVELEHSRR